MGLFRAIDQLFHPGPPCHAISSCVVSSQALVDTTQEPYTIYLICLLPWHLLGCAGAHTSPTWMHRVSNALWRKCVTMEGANRGCILSVFFPGKTALRISHLYSLWEDGPTVSVIGCIIKNGGRLDDHFVSWYCPAPASWHLRFSSNIEPRCWRFCYSRPWLCASFYKMMLDGDTKTEPPKDTAGIEEKMVNFHWED